MAVNGISGNSTTSTLVDKDKTGFNGLTADAFMKLLIAQLQNQDPTQPVGNEELLQQIATMRNLQSNIELSDTLKGFAQNQQITAGAAFLGRVVSGKNADQAQVTGVADSVYMKDDGQLYVGIGTQEIELSKVTGVGLVQ